MRKLATIRKISELKPIEGADAIECAVVDGWTVVVKKGEYTAGDMAVYLEIDSWVPHDLAPFLSKGKEPREFEGVKGERLRTVKLRGQLSQGLLLPLEPFTNQIAKEDDLEGMDVSEVLGILKWERPIPAQLAGQVRGNFPAKVPKTDQERIQNLTKYLPTLKEQKWSVTEKLDGSSVTFYLDEEGAFHVCSRNLDLKEDENNSYWKVARKFDIEGIMRRNHMLGMAIQGEMIGEGIQGNQYKTDLDFYVYDMYNSVLGQYILPCQLDATCLRLGLKHVPVIAHDFDISEQSLESLLKMAEGKSVLNGSEREGLVFKSETVHDLSFKSISNKWLLKGGD